MKHSQANLQNARYIVARYIRAGLEGAALRRKVERHAAMLRGTEPELADTLERVGLSEVRRLIEGTHVERTMGGLYPARRVTKAQHRAQVVAGICAGEEA